MKKILIAFSALVMGAAAASAADLPATYTKAPPVVAPIYNWSGFYVGLNGGGGSAHTCWDLLDFNSVALGVFGGAEGCHSATGGTVGGQIGYRWQATNWVFGVEAQGNWADFAGSNTSQALIFDTICTCFDNHTKIDAFGLFTGQIGYAWNNVLFYVKGGAAVVDDKYNTVVNAAGAAAAVAPLGTLLTNVSGTRWGGTVGAGLEFGFAPGWSVGVEYDHIFLGTTNSNQTFLPPIDTAGNFVTRGISQNVDMGLVRVNYTFGGFGGPPVVSRY